MRILHVTTFLQGGAGRMIAALALAQQRDGHEVLVVQDAGGAPGYGTYPEYRDVLIGAGVGLLSIASTFTRDLALNTSAARALRQTLRDWPPAVAHAHAAVPSMVARLAIGGEAVPIVQTMHGWGVAKTAAQATTDVALLNLADAVVTPSAAAREALATLGVSDVPVTVIPYGLSPREAASRGTAAIDDGDRALFDRLRVTGARTALCVGTVGARKNQRLLLEALASPRASGLHVVFIGDGDVDALRAEAGRLHVSDRAHILGYRADAFRYLPAADLVVLPSRNEGLPVALLEALREGVPVVASDLPEIAEAIEDRRTGYLFERESPEALAAALATALDAAPPDRAAMRQRMRQAFASRFTEERMVREYERLYDDCAARVCVR